jgi:1,4-alpha-glucan branching enzyme
MLNSKSKITEMAETPKSDVMALAKRRYPIGVELIGENETHFRVWAPKAQQVDLVLEENAAKNAKRTFPPASPTSARTPVIGFG